MALADFVSFNSDGFTLVVDDQFPAALEVSYALLGGTDLTDVAVGNFAINTSVGEADYTGLLGFTPDFALFVSNGHNSSPPVGTTNNRLSIGAATATEQAVFAHLSRDAQGTSITSSYCRAGEIFGHPATDNATVDMRVSFVSFLSDGFRLNTLETNTNASIIFFVALKGGSYKIGDFLSATNTTAFTEAHGMSSTPKGALFFSANRAASTQDVATGHYEWSVGASDGSVNTCQYVRDKDAAGSADCFNAVSHDQCYLNASSATTQALEGEGHVNSFDSSNINFQMTDADPAQSFIWYVVFGDGEAPAVLVAEHGSFALNGQSVNLLQGYKLEAGHGSFALNGQDVSFQLAHKIVAGHGSFALNGQDVSLRWGRAPLVAEHGSFALNGQDVTLRRGRSLTVDHGSFALNGQDVSLRVGRNLSANHGAFVLNGQAVALLFKRLFSVGHGAFALNGQDVSLEVGRVLQANHGAFAVNGQDVSFQLAHKLVAGHGAFAVNGQDASFLWNRVLQANHGAFALNGQDVNLIKTGAIILEAEHGSFALNGQDINFLWNHVLQANHGAFVFTGIDVDLSVGGGGGAVGPNIINVLDLITVS